MKQDEEDYKHDEKIKVAKLHKTITKGSKFGRALDRSTARRKYYVERVGTLRDKTA